MNYKGRHISPRVLFMVAKQGITIRTDKPVVKAKEFFEATQILVVKTEHGFDALCGPETCNLLGQESVLLSKMLLKRAEDLTQAEGRPAQPADLERLNDRYGRPPNRSYT